MSFCRALRDQKKGMVSKLSVSYVVGSGPVNEWVLRGLAHATDTQLRGLYGSIPDGPALLPPPGTLGLFLPLVVWWEAQRIQPY